MLTHVPWATRLVRDLINPGGRGQALDNLAQKMVGERLKVGSMTRDLFHHLVCSNVSSSVILTLIVPHLPEQ